MRRRVVFLLLCTTRSASSFGTTVSFTGTRIFPLRATTKAPEEKTKQRRTAMDSPYTSEQLSDALNSLLDGSADDASYDARAIYGYGDANHKLSMLQTIAGTTILDYQTLMSNDSSPSEQELLDQARAFAEKHGPILNLQQVIQSQSPRMALAAEFKRASPSKGDIAPQLHAGDQAKLYAQAGADIVSVLTEKHWFKGSLHDLTEARLATNDVASSAESQRPPRRQRPAILRKDFVMNTYMIAEAAAAGADTVLLIVAILPESLLKRLINYARSLDMEPLVEVHADEELDVALKAGARVIGVNNRNLHTFQMDLGTTEHVAQQLTEGGLDYHHSKGEAAEYTLCALSGMSSSLDVDRYRQPGVAMCLIGESLMRASDPSAAIASLCLHPDDFERTDVAPYGGGAGGVGGAAYTAGTKLVKVCGITNAEDALVACRAGANLIGVIFAPKSKRRVTASQACEVVQAVRKFGERNDRTDVSIGQTADQPLPKLVASARALEEAARRPMVVGVFQNQDPEFVRQMVAECGLDLVQLHGNEGMEAANTSKCGAPAIRVVDVETDPEMGRASKDAVDGLLQSITTDPVAILLDTSIKGSTEGGGTGVTFDWSIAQQVQERGLPIIIAGGLGVDNVKEAVANIRPFGVDVSSGVEASPGKKDMPKVQAFVKNARDAAIEASKGF